MGPQPRHVAGMVGRRPRQARIGPERGAPVLAADLVRVDQHRLGEERLVRAVERDRLVQAGAGVHAVGGPAGEHDNACRKQAQCSDASSPPSRLRPIGRLAGSLRAHAFQRD